jgi:hypothetical protein
MTGQSSRTECFLAALFLFLISIGGYQVLAAHDRQQPQPEKRASQQATQKEIPKTTAEDLLRFDIALRTNKLISAASRELIMTAKPELKSPDYGYAFGIGRSEKLGRTAGHSGGFSGISSVLRMYLDSGYAVVVLTNYGVGSQVALQKIEGLLSDIR